MKPHCIHCNSCSTVESQPSYYQMGSLLVCRYIFIVLLFHAVDAHGTQCPRTHYCCCCSLVWVLVPLTFELHVCSCNTVFKEVHRRVTCLPL